MTKGHLAFDFGAGSGRAFLGALEDKLEIEEISRFPNNPFETPNGFCWNSPYLFSQINTGVQKTIDYAQEHNIDLVSVGIDTWGVDYALINDNGYLSTLPRNYRDKRNEQAMEKVIQKLGKEYIYQTTGCQFMPINTLYQLVAHQDFDPNTVREASRLLMMPDLFNYFLSGKMTNETTIASTTQLIDIQQSYQEGKAIWAKELIERVGIPPHLFHDTSLPGQKIGQFKGIDVVTSLGHDTAGAVLSVPYKKNSDWCFISSGTWSVIGAISEKPIVNQKSYQKGFSNEIGFDNTFRIVRNVPGMWFLQECQSHYQETFSDLITAAKQALPLSLIFNPHHLLFSQYGNLPEKVRQYAQSTGQDVPQTKGQIVRACQESLALAYKHIIEDLEEVVEEEFDTIHIVGGGAKNDPLNQMTADYTGKIVVTGPYEASVTGNILTQAISSNDLTPEDINHLVKDSFLTQTYTPHLNSSADEAYEKYLSLLPKG